MEHDVQSTEVQAPGVEEEEERREGGKCSSACQLVVVVGVFMYEDVRHLCFCDEVYKDALTLV